jgi:NADH dehydrogenase [ubiquinone] 1 alpha subcomplex assembly factor 1
MSQTSLPVFLVGYLKRSVKHISLVLKESLGGRLDKKIPMGKDFFTKFVLDDWVYGSDVDIGGESECLLEIREKNLLFHGRISTRIPEESAKAGVQKSGYVGFRSKELPMTLLHTPRHNVELFRYLELRIKGDKRLWNVNIQTESLYPSALWQHRLYFSTPGQFETIRIPWRDFVKTDYG